MAEIRKVRHDFGKKCVCVGRVSTTIQSQTAQIRDLEDFARSWGFEEIKTFFTTESGFLEYDEKQGWNLVSDFFATHPDYKVLICSESSRLSRREHILHKIKDYLIDNKIQLIIKDINFQLFNEWGEISPGTETVFALYASLAASEMRQKKERKARALKDYRIQGFSIGGKELFGYDRYYEWKDGKNRSKYKINEKEADEIRTIYRWYAFGIDGDLKRTTILNVTKECIERGFSPYLHSMRNVNKCLKEQAYTGMKETHNRVQNPDYWNYHKPDAPKYLEGQSYICAYPPIFTGDDAALPDIVQERMKKNNSRFSGKGELLIDKSKKHTNILAKLLVCPSCGMYLTAGYRMAAHNQRPHLGKKLQAAYRCTYSRGAINTCSFKRGISVPMLDSVVWSYCKSAAYQIIKNESEQDVETRVSEIQSKIKNITVKIQEYDIESQIKAEDAILRARTKVLKDAAMIDVVVKEYEEHVASIEKELNDYKTRKLELEQEIKAIKNGMTFLESISKAENITTSKKLIYKYIHKVVEKIEFISWDTYHLVLKVHFKKAFNTYKQNEYICIYTKTTKYTTVLLVHSFDVAFEQRVKEGLNRDRTDMSDADNDLYKLLVMGNLPSTDALVWDKEEGKFKVEGFSFTLDELKDYYESPLSTIDPLNPRLGSSVVGAPVRVQKLKVERINLYEEDTPKSE